MTIHGNKNGAGRRLTYSNHEHLKQRQNYILPNIPPITGLNPKAGEFIPRQLNSLPTKSRGRAIKGLLLGPHDPSISTQAMAHTTHKRNGRVTRRHYGKHSKPLKHDTSYKRPLQLRRDGLVEKKVFLRQGQRQNNTQRYRTTAQLKPRVLKPKPDVQTTRGSYPKVDVAFKVSVHGWFNPNSPLPPPERVMPPNPNKPFLKPLRNRSRNLNTRFERFKPPLSSKRGGARPSSSFRRGKHINRFPAPNPKRSTKLPHTPTPKRKNDIKGLVLGPHDPSVKTQTFMNNRGRRKRKKRR